MYATADDLLATYEYQDLVQLTNLHDPTAHEVIRSKLEQHCQIATGIIDGYLMLKFTLPLVAPSEQLLGVLRAHCIVLARESLDATLEETRLRAEASRAWLERFTQADQPSLDKTPGADPLPGIAYEVAPPTWGAVELRRIGW